MANRIECFGSEGVEETAQFVRMMDKVFNCMNASNFSSGKHNRKSSQDPYRRSLSGVGTNDFHLKVCLNCIHIL